MLCLKVRKWNLFEFILFLDLPKLSSITFIGNLVLGGACQTSRQITINGHESFNNVLVMRSEFTRNHHRHDD